MLESRENRQVSLVQQQKSSGFNRMSLTRSILISHCLPLSLSHLVAKGFYNTKQRKVQSYAQATLNVQHQAIQTPHFCREHRAVQNSRTNKSRPQRPRVIVHIPVRLFTMVHRSTVPHFNRCSIQHIFAVFPSKQSFSSSPVLDPFPTMATFSTWQCDSCERPKSKSSHPITSGCIRVNFVVLVQYLYKM